MLPTLSRALKRLDLPVIAAPLPTISTPRLVVAQCKAGIVGSLSALNARSCSELDEWLVEIAEELGAWTSEHSGQHAAPFAVKQVIHANNRRLYDDMEVLLKHKVPIVITSQGLSTDANDAVHAYGGMTLHEVINNGLARNAIDKGSDGLIALAAGAGGNAGIKSPLHSFKKFVSGFLGRWCFPGLFPLEPRSWRHGWPERILHTSALPSLLQMKLAQALITSRRSLAGRPTMSSTPAFSMGSGATTLLNP